MDNSETALAAFKKHGPLTDIELAKHTGLTENSARPTRVRLEELGLIYRTDKVKNDKGKIVTSQGRRRGYNRIYKLTPSREETNKLKDDLKQALLTIAQYIEILDR